MRKRIESYSNRGYWSFSINVGTPYERDHREEPYNILSLSFADRSWFIKIPEFIKPKTYWVDTTNASWNENKEGPCGYTESVRKEYGITFGNEAIHLHYGIQPGSWSRDDPENSDHTKVFWYPWQLEIVRHDLLYPDGSVYYRNVYDGRKTKKYSWWEILSELDCPYPVYPNKDRVTQTAHLKHYNKSDGKLQEADIRLCGEEREWRPKCTKWLPIFRKISRVVDCDSTVELGTRAGSWKGGMMGWSTEWYDDETMHAAFWRWYGKWDGR